MFIAYVVDYLKWLLHAFNADKWKKKIYELMEKSNKIVNLLTATWVSMNLKSRSNFPCNPYSPSCLTSQNNSETNSSFLFLKRLPRKKIRRAPPPKANSWLLWATSREPGENALLASWRKWRKRRKRETYDGTKWDQIFI